MAESLEHIPERILTKEEVLEVISHYAENAVFVREFSDEQGPYFIEAKVEGKNPGEFAEYTYTRKGRYPNNITSPETSINVMFYKDDMPTTGDTVSVYDPETGEWKEGEKEPPAAVTVPVPSHIQRELSTEKLGDYKETVQKVEDAIDRFEKDFNLSELFAITNLTHDEAEKHPFRETARLALAPIAENLWLLKNKSDIPEDEYDALNERYNHISRAVGTINRNVVGHTG